MLSGIKALFLIGLLAGSAEMAAGEHLNKVKCFIEQCAVDFGVRRYIESHKMVYAINRGDTEEAVRAFGSWMNLGGSFFIFDGFRAPEIKQGWTNIGTTVFDKQKKALPALESFIRQKSSPETSDKSQQTFNEVLRIIAQFPRGKYVRLWEKNDQDNKRLAIFLEDGTVVDITSIGSFIFFAGPQ